MQSTSNQQQPVVSILIPCYNAAAFLPQCLDSIVNQTYQHLQVVVVDDGSEDNTLEIALQYAGKYPYIEVYHQENAGVAIARNKLISHATGDYVLFVDSDDWIELNMVERMLKAVIDLNVDIAVCSLFWEKTEGTLKLHVSDHQYTLEGTENLARLLLMHKEFTGSLWNKLISRKFYESLTFRKDIWYGEDCLFLWQVLNRGVQKICFMPDCLYHYRMNEQSISYEKFNYKKMSGHEVWKQINDDVQLKWPALSSLSKTAYAVSDMWLLYYAVKSNYKCDNNIRVFQKTIRSNFLQLLTCDFIDLKKKIFGLLVACSYTCGRFLTKLF